MSIFRRILFPVDFSEPCADAARPVAAMARQFNGKVILIHAIGDYERLYAPDAPSPDAWIAWLRETATAWLQSFGEPCLNDFVIDRRVHEGEPAAVIADYAAEQEIDLIMMPTHGRGMFRRFLLGSVTSRVLHDSTRPVWTTVHAPSPGAENTPIRTIVCAIYLTEASRCVLETAARIACESSASLHVVHATPMPKPRRRFRMQRAPKMMNVTMKPLGGETDAEVKTAVTAGVGKMKPVAGLAAADVDNVIAYVHTLKK